MAQVAAGTAALGREGLPVIDLLPADDKPEGVGLALHDNVHVHVPLGHFRGKQEVAFFAVRRIAADVDNLSVDTDLIHRLGKDELGDLFGHEVHVLDDARGQPHAVGKGGLAHVFALERVAGQHRRRGEE